MQSAGQEAVPESHNPNDYDAWRARRDIDRLIFEYGSADIAVPPGLMRVKQFLDRLDADR